MTGLTMHFPGRSEPVKDEILIVFLPRPGDEIKYDGEVYVVDRLLWDVDGQSLVVYLKELP